MASWSLGFTWAILALALAPALASCISPRNSAARTRRRVRGTVSTPALTPSLIVSRRRAWPAVTGPRRHPRIGVPGGAGAGGRTGRDRRGWAGGRGLSPRSPRMDAPAPSLTPPKHRPVQNEGLSGPGQHLVALKSNRCVEGEVLDLLHGHSARAKATGNRACPRRIVLADK